ncbi:hypothetical protein [Bosea sp. WAO]|uniref:hypothetical protein n=1 Tax=Bosea sp. WAO TaxID=406341 RepID=UPI000835D57E|nr:hypothetical protein [Bosea sp. WAO]
MANCFLVVNQATKWNMDPFGVAQCVSIVKGKLCYEGKLVAAVLDAKLGIELTFTYDGKKGDELGVVVSGVINGVTKTVEGTVGGWKTTGTNSPWSSPANHPRQLAYRGSREWARVHKPALMLGAYTDDELADLQDASRANRAREVAPPAPPATIAPPPPPAAEPSKAEIEDATILSETAAGAPPPSQPAASGAEASFSNAPAGDASASEGFEHNDINPEDEIGNLIDKLAHAKDEATVEEWYVETDIEAALSGFDGYVEKARSVRDQHLQRVRKLAAAAAPADAPAPPPPPPASGLSDDEESEEAAPPAPPQEDRGFDLQGWREATTRHQYSGYADLLAAYAKKKGDTEIIATFWKESNPLRTQLIPIADRAERTKIKERLDKVWAEIEAANAKQGA